jgi:hypothetical protein
MNRLEHQIVRDLQQIADRATPSPHRWNSILTRIAAQDPDTETEPEQQLVPVKEIYVSVDSPRTSGTRNRQRLVMAAAAVVVVIGVAAIAINSMNSDDEVEPAPAAATTAAPTTVAPRRVVGAFEPRGKRVTYAVPDGWENIGMGGQPPSYFGVGKGDPAIGVVFVGARYDFYTHLCGSALGGQVGRTIDDLVSAWTNLPGVDATAARDVTVDGFDAKEIELTVSAEARNPKNCSGMFSRCSFGDGGTHCRNELAGRINQELRIWILDIDDERLMILAGSFPDTSQQDRAALDEIVASIQIG